MSAGQLARHRSSSSSTRPSYRAVTPIDTRLLEDVEFEPCAATASIFLYTQGNAILCLHHDTLAIERRFELHKEKVLFIAVDNVSERDQGRLVVSYDASYTAIVWEINSGRQIASFISYEPYRVAAWMKNGQIAFGGSQGSVVLFTPFNTETESARTIFDPITAIAPAWDCQTYAIGYQNGSILLVRLEPIVPKPINGPNLSFTILHTLTTQRAPSPIVNLAWHASSNKQKSDMLASQTMDGDLRIWSVSKPPTADTPKTIRILKRRDNTEPGQHWCAWSKNGRVLQYSDGEAWSWDVRTKHVSCEPVPTIDGVRGIACFGAQATLFTLGPDHTVQQYDTSPPALVKNIRYGLMLPPPNRGTPAPQIPGTAPPVPVSRGSDEHRGAVTLSTIQNTANEMASIDHARQLREEMASPTLSSTSRTSRTDTMSSRSSNHRAYPRHVPSVSSRAQSGTTFSTVSPSMVGRDSLYSGTTSMYQSTASISSAGRRSKGSRLRQEVLRSPEREYIDLFPRTKMRLGNMSYQQQPQPLDQENLTPDELRRRMLEVVFGWEDDIEPLIRDELHYHRQGSQSGVLLAKWLGDVDSDMMAAAISSGGASSSDWMVLCLSQMGGSGMGKLGQAFVQRLLTQGEFHTAATILLGLDQREDAVEVYVSRSFYMESILLTCLVFPTDWQRQAHLVRRWGEFVVENSQQHLAIRCFSCTGSEPPIPWTSPSPGPISTPSQAPSSISSMLSPPVSPPLSAPPIQRMTAKNASLKVITSFEAPAQGNFRFPGLASTDRTPTNGPGVTPIAESAISPGGTPGGFDRRRIPSSLARGIVTPGSYMRNRLPSIGETPVDVTLPPFPRPSQLPTPDNSGSDLEKEKEKNRQIRAPADAEKTATATDAPPLLLTSARYDPGSARGQTPMTAVPQTTVRTTILPNPSQDSFTTIKEKSRARNGSRDRKPDGLHIRMPSQDQIQNTHYISSEGVISQGSVEHRRSNTLNSLHSAGLSTSGLSTGGLSTGRSDYRSDTKSPSISGNSWASAKSPSISGRSMDQYISSLEEAGYHQKKHKTSSRRHKSREGREHRTRSKGRAGDRSEDRGRDERKKIRPAKRSPSSPKPMSPETYIDPTSGEPLDDRIRSPVSEGRHIRDTPKTASKLRSGSKASNYSHHTDRTVRHRSPEGIYDRLGTEPGFRSGKSSRQPSPRGLFDPSGRGRSESKNGGSTMRSPSSPLPMSPQGDYYRGSDEDEDPLRIVEANRQRLRSRHRSRSRKPRERGTSSRRDYSTDRRRAQEDQYFRAGETDEPRSAIEPRRGSGDLMLSAAQQPKLHRQISERAQKKEMAARELEARRESLLRNPEAPPIPHPDEYSGRPSMPYRSHTDLSNSPTSWNPVVPLHQSQRFPENNGDLISRAGAASVGPYGLPATPRAMRHPRYDNKTNEIPAVPEIPDSVQPLPETYYTGQPKFELPRSMSAPIPEQQYPQRSEELPSHPAFHRGLRPGKRNNFSPLGDIGSHRRRPSDDTNMMTHPQDTSIDGILASADSGVQIVSIEEPPLLPELQHLQQQAIPPPPPPPPATFAHRIDPESSSLSSNSNVGVISMVLDNEPGDETNVIEVPPPPPPIVQPIRSPPIGTAGSPPPSMSPSSSSHRRGRSENFKNGFSVKGITDRLRSTSRGRNTRSPEHNTPIPYESVPPLYF